MKLIGLGKIVVNLLEDLMFVNILLVQMFDHFIFVYMQEEDCKEI